MEGGEGVIGEERALGAGGGEAEPDVFGGVFEGGRGEEKAMVNAGEEGAVSAASEAGFELGESDEDEGQERFGVPLVIQEDVKMSEHVGVEQVSLVEEEDGMERCGRRGSRRGPPMSRPRR